MTGRVLVAEVERDLRRSLARLLMARGFEVLTAEDPEAALAMLATTSVEVLIVPASGAGGTALAVVARAKERCPDVEVIVTAAASDVEPAVAAVRAGAYDFVTKPLVVEDTIPLAVGRAIERRGLVRRARALEERIEQHEGLGAIVGRSGGMEEAYRIAMAAAPAASPVLITGESGTGKELFARMIHRRGSRADRPLHVLRCGALPEGAIEDELFGVERVERVERTELRPAGSPPPGAEEALERPGLLELADQGTLFLDEVAALPLPAQAKLAIALARGEVTRLGGARPRRASARIIASTSADLRERVREGRLREDLFYRLGVISIHLPPLRRRKDDIPLLAYHFLHKHARAHKRDVRRISVEALRKLREHPWPGNVRELDAAIEHATVMARGESIGSLDLPLGREGEGGTAGGVARASGEAFELPYPEAKERVIEGFDRAYVEELIERAGGNLSEAARQAGMDRSNFKRLVRKVREAALGEGAPHGDRR